MNTDPDPRRIYQVREALELLANGFASEAIGALVGTPVLCVSVDDSDELTRLVHLARALPCVFVGVSEVAIPGAVDLDILLTAAPSPSRAWVAVPDLPVAVAALVDAVRSAPAPSVTLVQLLRLSSGLDVTDALVAESLAYSMLQSGPAHREWLSTRRQQGSRVEDDGPTVLVRRLGGTAEIRLNRPQVRNAYNAMMRDELVEALAIAADDSITEVNLHGNGPSFCSGGDLTEFGSTPDPVTAHLARITRNPAHWLSRYSGKITAHLHGACVGAGVELPSFVERVIADRSAFFMLPEVQMGLVPGAGGTVSIRRRIGRQRTAYMAITGNRISAATAHKWGLVDELVD